MHRLHSMTDDMTDTLDRSIPPKPGRPKDVSFPDYFEAVLSNGFKVIVYEQSFLPSVTLNLVAKDGSFLDGDRFGLASMTAELLTKGTQKRTATGIVEEIESLGGSIASGAGWDSSSVGITILSRHLREAMEVLADVSRNSTIPDEEIERVREQRLAAILQRKSNPSSLAYRRFSEAVYAGHPYGNPAEGSEQTVPELRREQMLAFHRSVFEPGNMFLIAVGDVRPEQLLAMAEELFGDWEKGEDRKHEAPQPELPSGRVIQVVDRPDAVQSSILIGHKGLPRRHDDFIAVHVMNTLLGGYFGSRLNLNLREDKGFTYGAFSRFEGRIQAGPFSAGAEVRNDVTDRAVDEILKEIRRLVEEPVSVEELTNVQRYMTGSFPIQIETPVQVAQRMINIEMYGLGKTYYNTYNSRILNITPAEISRVAGAYLHPDRLAIVAAGRAALLRGTLERFGSVEVFDADGARIADDASVEREDRISDK